jgi:hypothetical protein
MDNSKIIDELVKELKTIITTAWIQAGVDPNSNLINSIKPVATKNGVDVYAADYAKFVDSGRAKFTKKIPISQLILWVKKKGITPSRGYSLNDLAWAVQYNVYLYGIRGKNIFKKSQDAINKSLEPIIERLILNEIKKDLNKKIK